MNAKSKCQFLELAQRIMAARLTNGNRQDQFEAQAEIVASMLKSKVEFALAKVNSLKDELGKHTDGRLFNSNPSKATFNLALKEVNDSVAALLDAAQTAYDAEQADVKTEEGLS